MQRSLMFLPLVALAFGCSMEPQKRSDNGKPEIGRGAPKGPSVAAPQPDDPLTPTITRIDQGSPGAASFAPATDDAANVQAVPPANPFIIRAEVLLARARFSPGVVDGQFGTNFKHAILAYQTARNLHESGIIDDRTWRALLAEPASAQPAARLYTVTSSDVAGPFAPDVGEDFVKLAALPNGPQFTNPLEALAERFHMSQALLANLNPGADFRTPGARIVVVDDAAPAFARGDVARIDVSKADASVRAFDAADRLIAFYPATVGSTERPSPSGTHKVVGVAWHANYTYDPTKLAWGPRAAGKLLIKPGPNNPVGTVWIDLNAPGYGIHGTPEPDKIGKTASHGCVRLTNWDAQALAGGVKPGVVVRFIGKRGQT